ncbi:hypothetical protein QWY87_04320 [Lutimonas halocynthiae]|uniref:hypothetical protein n=1 Tax=Lutimonas halocynthiae TaxID=1446477 RepID=UPI0025B5BBC9|nr:hypothetical protein [Lutimonas halocynthiae]MDN3641911.1 hypothetical protein [Lutimonas halocynthiae]
MKDSIYKQVLTFVFIFCLNLQAFGLSHSMGVIPIDTLKSKADKKLDRQNERDIFKSNNKRFKISFDYVHATLDTEISFELPEGNLHSVISLENDLGLPSNSYFFTGSFLYRITPSSGLYAQYYGINRKENTQTKRDLIFKGEIIPAGTDIEAHFNTQVISTGYLYSVLKNPDAHLGFYFNIYLMFLETAVQSAYGYQDLNVELVAPLPNFGILASFKLNKWLYFNGNIGFFALKLEDFGGSLHNLDIAFMAKPVDWLGIDLSYQVFDVMVEFPSDDINTKIDYNFRGPSIGLSFFF